MNDSCTVHPIPGDAEKAKGAPAIQFTRRLRLDTGWQKPPGWNNKDVGCHEERSGDEAKKIVAVYLKTGEIIIPNSSRRIAFATRTPRVEEETLKPLPVICLAEGTCDD